MKSLILLAALNMFSGVSYDTSNLVYVSGFFNNSCLLTLHLCAIYDIELLALERLPHSTKHKDLANQNKSRVINCNVLI